MPVNYQNGTLRHIALPVAFSFPAPSPTLKNQVFSEAKNGCNRIWQLSCHCKDRAGRRAKQYRKEPNEVMISICRGGIRMMKILGEKGKRLRQIIDAWVLMIDALLKTVSFYLLNQCGAV